MIRRLRMMVASIETTLELWASTLRDVKRRMRELFAQERSALNAELFLDGLLSDERRKTGWMRAEAAGDPGPWRQQALLGRDRWEADALRDVVRDYVIEHLADEDAVLVIDETSSRVRLPAAWPGNILARPARSRIARSACSPRMCRATVMLLLIGPCISQKLGLMIQSA